jgi:hypothetical protein
MANGQNGAVLKNLQGAWKEVVIKEEVKDPNTQALIGGVNLRVNARKALEAVYLTAQLYLKGKLALTTANLGPEEIADMGKMFFELVATTLDALLETLRDSTYVTCVVLAGHPAGLTPVELEQEVKAFVEGADAAKLPFYMGFTDKFLSNVRNQIGSPRAFGTILEDLRKEKWVTESDGRLFFEERHFVWGAPTLS